MFLDEANVFPSASGTAILTYHEVYGLLQMDDWKMAIGPHVGFRPESENSFLHARKLRCPQVLATADGGRGNGQYGYNGFGTAKFQSPSHLGLGGAEWTNRTHESRVLSPASMIAAGDIAPGRADGKYFRSLGVFDVCSTNRAAWPGSHHNRQANILFADGHVEAARQSTWIFADHSARARWNNDHEPHPETWKRP
jgi:prepilin-type processing-associated H-X9-DG protein